MTTRRTVEQFRRFIVRPTLQHLDPLIPYSEAAELLLAGTAVHESGLDNFDQWLGPDDVSLGPAYGIFQIEPATYRDLMANFLAYRKPLAERVAQLLAPVPTALEQLVTNLSYATAIARVIYYRAPAPLPAAGDAEALAAYWKQVYNTPSGKGTPAQWLQHYRSLVS